MAVSAYASLVSLTHLLDNVHYRAHHRCLQVDIVLIETLQEKVHLLLDFVEAHSQRQGEDIRGLWRQISQFAFDADRTFDSHVLKQILHQSDYKRKGPMAWLRNIWQERNRASSSGSRAAALGGKYTSLGEITSDSDMSAFDEDVDRLIQKTDFINKELLSAVEADAEDALVVKRPVVYVPSGLASGGKGILVGFEKHMFNIMDKLTSDESKLQIVPIIGMGGIGKTTLARNVFDNSSILDHFDKRIWLTISQHYSVELIIGGLLGYKESDILPLAELGVELHKTLYGRRYLIVMDDVWTAEACEELMIFFPDNKNGSRIIITTRLLEVTSSLGCQKPYSINFLNKDQSWNLLCQTIFTQNNCPRSELEDIGKEIAKNTRGLPLAIVVIGGLLAKSNMTQEYWEIVSKTMYALCNLGDNEHCLKVLSLSYNTLPISLKPCFLYLRVFPEDDEIDLSRLIRFFVDEGFIKQNGHKSLEDVAKEYVNDLIGRNLLFIRERLNCGKVLLCGIHDLLRELCIQESDNENFLLIRKIHCLDDTKAGYSNDHLGQLATNSGRLRHIKISARLMQIEHRPLLSVLWNLHTLVLHCTSSVRDTLPTEIWDMTQLRHVEVLNVALPQPDVHYVEGADIMTMKNLQVLSTTCMPITEEVLARIQNLKTLELKCPLDHMDQRKRECHYFLRILMGQGNKECPDYSLRNLVQLDRLEVLIIRKCIVANISFPNSLKKLFLKNLENPSKVIPIIGSLPNLEELELYEPHRLYKWSLDEGQFLQLKGFLLESRCLEDWEVDESHFPKLEWLKLSHCDNLKEIPLAIGDITTLRSIDLFKCSESALESAKQLWEEQQNYGNESLQLHVTDHNYREHQFGVCQPIYLNWTLPAYLE